MRSLEWAPRPLDRTQVVLDGFSAIQPNRVLQLHPHLLPQTHNQLFLQRALVSVGGKQFENQNLEMTRRFFFKIKFP